MKTRASKSKHQWLEHKPLTRIDLVEVKKGPIIIKTDLHLTK